MDYTATEKPLLDFGNCMNTITSIANNINPPSESARMDMEMEMIPYTGPGLLMNQNTNGSIVETNTSKVDEISFDNPPALLQNSFSLNKSFPLGNSSLLNTTNISSVMNTSCTINYLGSQSDKPTPEQQGRITTKPLTKESSANVTNTQLNTSLFQRSRCTSHRTSFNSSKIVLNTSANFSSIRIEKKVPLLSDDSSSNLAQIIQNIPELTDMFAIQEKVGEGTFSKVYRARHLLTDEQYALKCIIPTIKPSRIIPELRYLRDMGGDSNVIEIKTCFFGGGFTVLVMPYFQHDRFIDYVMTMSVLEIKEYMRNLLLALKKVHSHGVIHRDVKPNNFLYNRREKRYALVDFGLAQNEQELLKNSKAVSAAHQKLLKPALSGQSMGNMQPDKKITANSLLASAEPGSKLFCVRKRLLMADEPTLNAKKYKFDSPSKQFRNSSVFGTPQTPRTKGLANMTNLTPGNDLAPLPMMTISYGLMSTPVKQATRHEPLDLFKTPTKRDKENSCVVTRLTGSPHQIIPETPPKSAKVENRARPPVLTKVPAPKLSPCKSVVGDSTQPSHFPVLAAAALPAAAVKSCSCYGTEQVCKLCMRRVDLIAPRAGTPGFRAPEVLLKQLNQTSAIDIWSAGVMFASLLTRRYPFFRNADDLTSLAEIISVFGTKRVANAAFAIGRTIVTSAKHQPSMDLKQMCSSLRGDGVQIDDSAFDLLDKLLDPNPHTRITAADALDHPFLANPYLL